MDLGIARRLLDLVLRCPVAAIGDVVADRVIEQNGVLRHHTDGLMQAFRRAQFFLWCLTLRADDRFPEDDAGQDRDQRDDEAYHGAANKSLRHGSFPWLIALIGWPRNLN